MTAARDATIAARVPLDLRKDLESIVARDKTGDPEATLTTVIRRLLRRAADDELAGRPTASQRLFANTPGASRAGGTATQKAAAAKTAPRVGTTRRLALAIIAGRDQGATTDEVLAEIQARCARAGEKPPAANGIPRRVTDLLQAGAIEPLLEAGHIPATRPTRHGAEATVYVATALGRRWLTEETTR